MRRLLILWLLAGCDAAGEGDAPSPSAASSPGAQQRARAPMVSQDAQARRRVQQALAPILADPEGARYSDLRAGAAGALCGRVEAGQGEGPRPFVVTPEGVAVISATGDVKFDDPEDVFPDFHIRWCASPEELRRIGPRLIAEGVREIVPAGEPANVIDDAMLTAGAPPEGPAIRPVTPPPPPAEDSFSRAVMRNGSDGAAR